MRDLKNACKAHKDGSVSKWHDYLVACGNKVFVNKRLMILNETILNALA